MKKLSPALRLKTLAAATLVATTAATTAVNATEGGGGSWPTGIEIYGMGILPPPGTYGQIFAGNYQADSLRDNSGHKTTDIDLRVSSITPRFIWVTDQKVFGGQLGFHALLPLEDMRLNIKNGPHDHKTGIGDMHFGAVLGYHPTDKFHVAGGLDIVAPTGSEYDKHDIINLGRNHWTAEGVLALTYMDPTGFNADIRMMYDYNFENRATNYKSGQELHADYTAGWAFAPGLVIGVGGSIYKQISDDKCSYSNCDAAADVDAAHGNRGALFAIGPAVQYSSPNGWQLSLKWQDESHVRNRPDGQAYWVKFTTAL